MSGFDVFFCLLLVGYVLACALLTARVWRNKSFERRQKLAQSQLIWLVPVIGAVLVFSLMPDDDDYARPKTHLRG
jgi:uncharacterized membrane protein